MKEREHSGRLSAVRQTIEEMEIRTLSPFATPSRNSRGRLREERPCDVRTVFSQDRDRIIHSKYFRRLKHKTQVFLAPVNDLVRTRLTHTLEVMQIATTIARALNVNRDLTEAVALGHDLGHTPFGHIGEYVLNRLSPSGFHHSHQSLRVVDKLEKPGGLNLTFEVRDGISRHSKGGKKLLPLGDPDCPKTIEGEIVRVSDSIAYINHDIDDALRAGVIRYSDLPRSSVKMFGTRYSRRISVMVYDIVERSRNRPHVSMSARVLHQTEKLRNYLFQHVYVLPAVNGESRKASRILSELFHYFLKNPKIPLEYMKNVEEKDEKKETVILDYLATLTDLEVIELYKKLFEPVRWVS